MGRGMKGQMKEADRSGARWAAIIGDDELAAGEVTLKDLKTGEQERVARNELAEIVHDRHAAELEYIMSGEDVFE